MRFVQLIDVVSLFKAVGVLGSGRVRSWYRWITPKTEFG